MFWMSNCLVTMLFSQISDIITQNYRLINMLPKTVKTFLKSFNYFKSKQKVFILYQKARQPR